MREAYPKNLSRDVKLLDFLEISRIFSCVHESGKKRPGHSYETLTNDLILVTDIDSSRK